MMKLTGIELRNFRSIGNKPVVLNPLKKCNILIGQNNAGKSNVLNAVQRISDLHRKNKAAWESLDMHMQSKENPFLYKLYFTSEGKEEEFVRLAGTTSFDFDFSWQGGAPSNPTDNTFARITDFGQANKLLDLLANRHWPGRVNSNVIREEFLKIGTNFFTRFSSSIPEVYIVPEFRQIRPPNPGETTEYGLSGKNLIETLASYQHPNLERGQDKEKFSRIEDFVKRLLHLPQATLEVTYDKSTITLTNRKLRLPLASYGTGVHELVILVTAVLSVDNAICCIEEPEIHLHPRLQREFIDFITTETTNQYLISTHSPIFINAINSDEKTQIFHLHLEDGATVGGPVSKDLESLTALHDLGVKASDILQSNCIIWVEGPTDRIYLQKWLQLIAPEIIEGRHYSIMYYGGRLLSHLSADREKVPDELVGLLKINQNAIVVMDSDRENDSDDINETKKRVKQECECSGGICWISEGREIENYLSKNVVASALADTTGEQIDILITPYTRFEHTLIQAMKDKGMAEIDYKANKVKYARIFAGKYQLADIDDQLRSHIQEVVSKIKYWNE